MKNEEAQLNSEMFGPVDITDYFFTTGDQEEQYMDRESCTLTDGCDNTFEYYEDYKCDWHNYDADPDMVYPWQPEYICEAGEPNAR